MGINLGALASGYLSTKQQFDEQDARDRINQLNDLTIKERTRDAKLRAANDDYLNKAAELEKARANSPATAGVALAQPTPDAQPAPGAPAAPPGESAMPGQVMPGLPQSMANDAPGDQAQSFAVPPQPKTDFRPIVNGVAVPPADAAPATPPSSSPLVSAVAGGVKPQGDAVAQPAPPGRPGPAGPPDPTAPTAPPGTAGPPDPTAPPAPPGTAGPPSPTAPAAPQNDNLRHYRTAIDLAMQDKNAVAAEGLRRGYVTALANEIQQGDAEFRRKVQPLIQAQQYQQVTHALMTGPVLMHQQAVGTVMLALITSPHDKETQRLAESVLGYKGVSGVKYGTDDATGQAMMVLTDKDGKAILGKDGQPVARPADLMHKLALSAPGGQAIAPQMIEWETKASDGTVYSAPKTVPAGSKPDVLIKSVGPGPAQQEAIHTRVAGEVKGGIKSLDNLVLNPGALSGLGNVKEEYTDLYLQGTRMIEKIVHQQHSAGQTPDPQDAANQVWEGLKRAVAIQKADPKTAVNLEQVMRGAPATPAARAAPAARVTADDVSRKLKF